MFKKDSFKRNHELTLKSPTPKVPVYREAKHEILRTKRCHSNNSPRHIITAIDNFIHKLNDKRKTLRATSYSSDSQSSSSTVSDSSVDSSKIRTKLIDSPRSFIRSTIRSFKRPNLKHDSKKDEFYHRTNRIEDLEESSILKSLLDSQQYLLIKNRLSTASIQKLDDSSSDNSNTSCIIHDLSDESDCISNQTFVEHESSMVDVPQGWSVDCTRKYNIDNSNLITHWDSPKSSQVQHEGYSDILAKLNSSYLKSPNSIVNKVEIPDWIIKLSEFSEENIQWDSLDLKSLELYDLMLQRIHKYELMELIEKHEKYRAKLNEALVKS